MNQNFLKFACEVVQKSSHILYRLDKKTLKIDDRSSIKLRYIVSKLVRRMIEADRQESMELVPPDAVRGMTNLQKETFTKCVKIPGLKVAKKEISRSQKSWKPVVLKVPGLKPVAELSDKDPLRDSHSLILLDPHKLKEGGLSTNQTDMLNRLGLDLAKPERFEVTLSYENWSVADVMRAVLPSGVDNVTSYTQVGHIAHLNLKTETLPFKGLIGQVILDKVPSVKTVVNKLNTIDNTYRNFSMELLAGEDNFVTQTKEHNCVFELDFSKVYWNSRLATEHQRIVECIPKGSLVYDVFAGIGPFSIPLAKKKQCTVLANDLNPASFESLNKNIKLNKIKEGNVSSWNLDGREFILTVVKNNLEERVKQYLTSEATCSVSTSKNGTSHPNACLAGEENQTPDSKNSNSIVQKSDKSCDNTSVNPSYIIMNLPAIAVEFLDAFRSLLQGCVSSCPELRENPEALSPLLPQVFCYSFSPKGDIDTELRQRVEKYLGCPLPPDYSSRVVRNVAPNKEMMCVSFRLWPGLVLDPLPGGTNSEMADSLKREGDQDDETESKKQKVVPG